MQKLISLFALIFFSILVTSCNENDYEINLVQNDYLIFGHFYGQCIGDGCVQTFKLTNEKLYEDLNHNYSGAPFNFVELENEIFNTVISLMDAFPSQLISETEEFLGCPDCADQGGLYIEYKKEGVIKKWKIDQSKSQVPNYLHDFIDTINEKIGIISN